MKCLICHGQDVRPKDVQEELRLGDDVIYVPIRTPVCQTCGERYYDRRTMQFLENTEQLLKQGQAKLRQVGKVMVVE